MRIIRVLSGSTTSAQVNPVQADCTRSHAILQHFLFALLFSAITMCSTVLHAYAEEEEEVGPLFSTEQLTQMEDRLIETGVQPDQIPALFNPTYITVADASLSLDDNDVVFIARLGPQDAPEKTVRVFPQRIMVWHEVVNQEVDGEYYSITYSPLTGVVTGYLGMVGSMKTIFGVSGSLLNANTVLFDRITGSFWPQLTGVAISEPQKGARLQRFPVLWSRWKNVKNMYPNAKVLSRATGFRRSYGKDPYGSYHGSGTYYDAPTITYPVMNVDRRLLPKERVIGIEHTSQRGVLVRNRIKREEVYNFVFGTTPMVAFWDRQLDTVRIFERTVNGKMLDFTADGALLEDTATRSAWSPEGRSLSGILRGSRLTPVIGVEAMWFAWSAFYPDCLILPRQ